LLGQKKGRRRFHAAGLPHPPESGGHRPRGRGRRSAALIAAAGSPFAPRQGATGWETRRPGARPALSRQRQFADPRV